MNDADELVERELLLNRFKRLLGEVIRRETSRNSFQPWEIEILLDVDACQLESRRRLEILRQYQRAVERQMEIGPGPPMKLSQFLVVRAQRRNGECCLEKEAAGNPDGSRPLLPQFPYQD